LRYASQEKIKSTVNQVSAGIIIYRKTKDGPRFLLLYHGGSYWNFPKGKLERGEGSYDAALREVYEETGLSRQNIRINPRFRTEDRYAFRERKERILKIVFYFLGESSESRIRISHEHQGYGWFLYRDCARMLMYQNLRNNLKQAYELISGKSLPSREAHPQGAGHYIPRRGSGNRFP